MVRRRERDPIARRVDDGDACEGEVLRRTARRGRGVQHDRPEACGGRHEGVSAARLERDAFPRTLTVGGRTQHETRVRREVLGGDDTVPGSGELHRCFGVEGHALGLSTGVADERPGRAAGDVRQVSFDGERRGRRAGAHRGELREGFGLVGHPEIELALIKLYHLTKEKKHLDLAAYFINERGQQPPRRALDHGCPETAGTLISTRNSGDQRPPDPITTPAYQKQSASSP